eukprot:2297578-Rhodomonas_salina.2
MSGTDLAYATSETSDKGGQFSGNDSYKVCISTYTHGHAPFMRFYTRFLCSTSLSNTLCFAAVALKYGANARETRLHASDSANWQPKAPVTEAVGLEGGMEALESVQVRPPCRPIAYAGVGMQ